jgi:hypothetical protein
MRIEKLLDPLMPDLNRLKEWCAQKSRLIENVERCKSVVGVLKLAGRVSAQQETEFNRLVRLFDDACDRRDLEDAMRLSLREVPGFGPLHEFIVLCRGGSRS